MVSTNKTIYAILHEIVIVSGKVPQMLVYVSWKYYDTNSVENLVVVYSYARRTS